MKITAGKWRGQSILTPKGEHTRPTPSRLREAIFNSIQSKIEGADVLDLFAGSGIMTLEAMSRGARSSLLVENHSPARRCIEKNLEHFGLQDEAALFYGDVFKMLRKINKSFDFIYADPPYKKGYGKTLMELVDTLSLLKEDGVFFLEEGEVVEPKLSTLKIVDIRSYGSTRLHRLVRHDEPL